MMNALHELLDRMLPGDASRGLPAFSALGMDFDTHFPAEKYAAVVELASDAAADEDVNQVIRRLRGADTPLTQALVETALDLYFTHPQVTAVLQQGRTTLFPHARSLDAMNYDLLEPVFEQQRGSFS